MPFGISVFPMPPSTFPALMNDVFKEQLRRFVLVFFDDILEDLYCNVKIVV